MHLRVCTLLALAVPFALAACGGPPAPEAPAAASAEPSAAPAAGKSLLEHRREFLERCGAKMPGAPDYCECSWDQMAKMFSLDELNAPGVDDAKIAQFKERAAGACMSKVPEDVVKAGFLKACAGDFSNFGPYCECSWTGMRKHFSAAQLNDEGTLKDPRFKPANMEAGRACSAKFPEEVAHVAFMRGCAEDPANKPFCECAYKALLKSVKPIDIFVDNVDIAAQKPKMERACAKLRPAAK
jgi:hypothetical protein